MSADLGSDPAQNPYNPFEETDRYRAFQNGWRARFGDLSGTGTAYPFADAGSAHAWLDGWRAAQEARPKTEQDDRRA